MSIGLQVEYRKKAKAHIRDGDTELVGMELQALAERHGQQIAPDAVVEAARDPQSAMHRYFEWDDTAAAAAFRLVQARKLIASIEVKVITKPGPNPETAYMRKFHHVRTSEPTEVAESRYVPLEVVTSRESYLNQVIANAERELYGWRERVRTYQSFKEFARFKAVLSAIDRLRDDDVSLAAD